jgi:hypothetical protein
MPGFVDCWAADHRAGEEEFLPLKRDFFPYLSQKSAGGSSDSKFDQASVVRIKKPDENRSADAFSFGPTANVAGTIEIAFAKGRRVGAIALVSHHRAFGKHCANASVSRCLFPSPSI